MSDIRCEYESASFPENQFTHDDEHGVVHQVTPLHTTDGDLIDAEHKPSTDFPDAAPPL